MFSKPYDGMKQKISKHLQINLLVYQQNDLYFSRLIESKC